MYNIRPFKQYFILSYLSQLWPVVWPLQFRHSPVTGWHCSPFPLQKQGWHWGKPQWLGLQLPHCRPYAPGTHKHWPVLGWQNRFWEPRGLQSHANEEGIRKTSLMLFYANGYVGIHWFVFVCICVVLTYVYIPRIQTGRWPGHRCRSSFLKRWVDTDTAHRYCHTLCSENLGVHTYTLPVIIERQMAFIQQNSDCFLSMPSLSWKLFEWQKV